MVFYPDRRPQVGTEERVPAQPSVSHQTPPLLPYSGAAQTTLHATTRSLLRSSQEPRRPDSGRAKQQECLLEGLATEASAPGSQPRTGREQSIARPSQLESPQPVLVTFDMGSPPSVATPTPSKYTLRSTRARDEDSYKDKLRPGSAESPGQRGRSRGNHATRNTSPAPGTVARPRKRPRPSDNARDIARVLRSDTPGRTRRGVGIPAMPVRSE